jgi:hypothetical protein
MAATTLGSSSITLTQTTFAGLQTLIAGELLKTGSPVLVTDRCHLGMVLDTVSSSSVSLEGSGGFLNADWDGTGDYSDTPLLFTVQQGVWTTVLDPTLLDGDVVIWDNTHYQVTDETLVNGTDPSVNAAAFTGLARSSTMGYKVAWDAIEYDVASDWLQRRKDTAGNDYLYTKAQDDSGLGLGSSPVLKFQWGNANLMNSNKIRGHFNEPNMLAAFRSITMMEDSTLEGNTFDVASGMGFVTLEKEVTLSNKTFPAGVFILNSTLGLPMTVSETMSSIIGKTTRFGYSNIEATFTPPLLVTIDYSGLLLTFQVCETITASNGATATVTTDNGVDFMTATRIAGDWYAAALTITGGTSGATASTIVVGETYVDVGAAKAEYCGIIRVGGLAVEKLSAHANSPVFFNYTIRPEDGTTIIFRGNLFGPAAAGEFVTPAGTDLSLSYPEIATWTSEAGPIVYLDSNEGIV